MARIQALVQELPHTVSMATKNKTKQKPTHTQQKPENKQKAGEFTSSVQILL